MFITFVCAAAAGLMVVALTGCGEKAATMEDLTSTDVTLPSGTKLVCETMRQDLDLNRGLMFRDPLPPNRGMLFVYPKDGFHSHFMYQVKFPIDTIWMDHDRDIVEIVTNMPPCPAGKKAHECPTYGGQKSSRFVLEVPAGFVAKNDLHLGVRLDF
jgi:uncharacterized protein